MLQPPACSQACSAALLSAADLGMGKGCVENAAGEAFPTRFQILYTEFKTHLQSSHERKVVVLNCIAAVCFPFIFEVCIVFKTSEMPLPEF